MYDIRRAMCVCSLEESIPSWHKCVASLQYRTTAPFKAHTKPVLWGSGRCCMARGGIVRHVYTDMFGAEEKVAIRFSHFTPAENKRTLRRDSAQTHFDFSAASLLFGKKLSLNRGHGTPLVMLDAQQQSNVTFRVQVRIKHRSKILRIP